MRRLRSPLWPLPCALAALPLAPNTSQAQDSTNGQGAFTLEQVRSYPFAGELVAATRAPRIAWAFNEQGRRNIWVGEAPGYEARKLTSFDRDVGQELSSVTLSADGRYVAFVRGGDHDCNWDCTVPVNPTSSPVAPVVSVWIAPFDGSAAHAIGDGDTPAISPRGDVVAYVRDRQIWVAPLDGSRAPRRMFAARGDLREPSWSPDGRKLAFVAELFERPGPPSRKPAVIFAHGGPERQMLLGWHSMDYYASAYALNQYLASSGYVVLSVNYRLGVGYGFDFHRIADGWSRGASEYQDIEAAGRFLRTLPQVDGARIGIYGGSYGGFLTAMALAKNSDLFAVGVDIHGPSDWTADNASRIGGLAWDYEKGDRARAADVAFNASPVAHVDGWRSPVLFIHGDDDRNTRFSHTIDLVNRLEVRGMPYEELIIPDDTHHWMRHANALRVWEATAEFLGRYLRPGQ